MKKEVLFTISLMSVVMFFVSGCSGDDDSPKTKDKDPIKTGYVISTVSGAWPNMTTYVQWVSGLDFASLDNDNATELSGSASTVSYEGAVYATPFGAPASLVKYTVGSNAVPKEEERIIVPGANTFSTLYFKSNTVAYGTVAGGISKLVIFNPSTMRVTGEVSLSAVTKRNPEATRTYYLDMLERDGKLFMGVHFEKNFLPVNDSAYVAVINLAENKVEKILADGRTGMVFGGHAPNAGMIKEASGDIYVQALGTTHAKGSSPSGLLRIKKGETDFDPDFFIDLDKTVGNVCYGLYHTSSGHTFTAKVNDKTDFWEFSTGQPQFNYVEIDLQAKKSMGAVPGLPTTYGSRRMIIHEMDDGDLLFTTATNDENAVYRYDLSSRTSSKYFTSTGGYVTGLKKLD